MGGTFQWKILLEINFSFCKIDIFSSEIYPFFGNISYIVLTLVGYYSEALLVQEVCNPPRLQDCLRVFSIPPGISIFNGYKFSHFLHEFFFEDSIVRYLVQVHPNNERYSDKILMPLLFCSSDRLVTSHSLLISSHAIISSNLIQSNSICDFVIL